MGRRGRNEPANVETTRLQRTLAVANIVGAAGQSIAGAASALLAQHVASTAYAGLPQALLVAGTSIATIAVSRASQKWGRPRALAASQLVALGGAAAGAVAALTASLVPLLIGSLLIGAGQAAVLLARYAAADHAPPALRARAMGRLLTATTLGAVLGPNLLGPSDAIGTRAHLPSFTGSYLIAVLFFTVAALTLCRVRVRHTVQAPDRDDSASWSRRNLSGFAVLSGANLIMIAVMTMAPLHLEHLGSGLAAIGVVVSVHIAGMFLPSSASGYLTARLGGARASVAAGTLLAIACIWAATTQSGFGMAGAMLLLGCGWNLALLSGSALITEGVPEHLRPRREGLGDASMGLTAAVGGVASGVLMQTAGYQTLAVSAAAVAFLVCAVLVVSNQTTTT